jgi:hypothetical protein
MKPEMKINNVKKYRKKPVIIEAVQWFDDVASTADLFEFCDDLDVTHSNIAIKTPEGDMKISIGDYVIKGTKGEFYPCKPDIFEEIYELI